MSEEESSCGCNTILLIIIAIIVYKILVAVSN